jgi:uncharacterized membrane protein
VTPDVAPGPPTDRRIRAFDLARGLAVLFMVLVHVLFHFGAPEAWASAAGTLVIFFGGPLAAPVFMFLMGASLAFSSRSSGGAIARRGLWLLALAYGLNVLRGALPAWLGLSSGVVTAEQIWPYTVETLLGMVDIHQMAGLSLLLVAGLAPIRREPLAAIGLAILAALVSPALWGRTTGIQPVDAAVAPLWGTDWNVFFPLFPWLAYPLAGLAYGTALVRYGDPRAFVRSAGRLGAVIGLVGLVGIVLLSPIRGQDDYWRPAPTSILAIIGLAMTWLAVCEVAVSRIRHNAAFGVLYGWSARVTAMYCIHWILIGWGVGLVGHSQLPPAAVPGAMVAVLVLTHWITRLHPRLAGRPIRGAGAASLLRP